MNHFNYGIIIGAIESAPLLGAYDRRDTKVNYHKVFSIKITLLPVIRSNVIISFLWLGTNYYYRISQTSITYLNHSCGR